MSSAYSSQSLTILVTCVQETRKYLPTSTSSSPLPSSESTRNSAMITQARSIRVVLRDTLSADSAVSASMETTSYTHIAETSTNDVTSVTAEKAAASSSIMSTTTRSSSISARTTSCVQTESAWRRSSWFSIPRWTSRPIRLRRIRTV